VWVISRLNNAVSEAKAKFPKFSPMIDKIVKTCEEENACACINNFNRNIQYGISSEKAMEDRLKIAKMILGRWVGLSKVAGKATGTD